MGTAAGTSESTQACGEMTQPGSKLCPEMSAQNTAYLEFV